MVCIWGSIITQSVYLWCNLYHSLLQLLAWSQSSSVGTWQVSLAAPIPVMVTTSPQLHVIILAESGTSHVPLRLLWPSWLTHSHQDCHSMENRASICLPTLSCDIYYPHKRVWVWDHSTCTMSCVIVSQKCAMLTVQWLVRIGRHGARRNLSAMIELYVQLLQWKGAAPAVQCLEGRPFTFSACMRGCHG